METHLEGESALNLLCEHIGNGLVKVGENLHGELWLDAALGDEIVKCVCKGAAQAATVSAEALLMYCETRDMSRTCSYGRARSTWSRPPC